MSVDSLLPLFNSIQSRFGHCLVSQTLRYEIRGNDLNQVSVLSSHLSDLAHEFGANGEASKLQLCMALQEAITNSIVHGNLEISSITKEGEQGEFMEEVATRRSQSPYQERIVKITAQLRAGHCEIVVEDEGNGFDPSAINDPTMDDNLFKPYGRGLMMIKAFCDEVHFNETGNEIRMIKRAE